MSLTRWPVCSRPTRTASSAALEATVDATASVTTRTTATTTAVPMKMRHANPTLGARVARDGAAGGGVGCGGESGTVGSPPRRATLSGCVRSVDVSAIGVVFSEFVLVLDVFVSACVQLILEILESRRGNHERVHAFAAAVVPHMNGVLAGRDLLDVESSIVAGLREVRRLHRDDEGRHLRMHVAVDGIHARGLEHVVARLALAIRLRIERTLRRFRKGVVC